MPDAAAARFRHITMITRASPFFLSHMILAFDDAIICRAFTLSMSRSVSFFAASSMLSFQLDFRHLLRHYHTTIFFSEAAADEAAAA